MCLNSQTDAATSAPDATSKVSISLVSQIYFYSTIFYLFNW